MADNPTQTYCPICERAIKTNARGLLHRHKSGMDKAEVCPGSRQPPVDEATIIAAANERLRQALRQMTRSRNASPPHRAPGSVLKKGSRGSIAWLWARAGSSNIRRGLVFPEALVNDLPQQPILRPRQKLDLRNEFGSDPMHAREGER